MALSETDLQDILSGLTPEEQKQLFERLGKTFGNDVGTAKSAISAILHRRI